ncbi:MAG: hypothetical protein ABR565_01125 [Gammaproteobacteria bacterium]
MLTSIFITLALAPAPTAIVDSVVGVPGVAPLQLLAPGTDIELHDGARVRLAYFASCVHETARGGRLRIGVTASLTVDAIVERVIGDCVPPQYGPSRAGVPGVLVLRDGFAARHGAPVQRIRTRTPLLLATPGTGITLTRMNPGGRKIFFPAADGRADLAEHGIALEDGALYRACSAQRCRRLWVDPAVQHERGPVLERVVRVP